MIIRPNEERTLENSQFGPSKDQLQINPQLTRRAMAIARNLNNIVFQRAFPKVRSVVKDELKVPKWKKEELLATVENSEWKEGPSRAVGWSTETQDVKLKRYGFHHPLSNLRRRAAEAEGRIWNVRRQISANLVRMMAGTLEKKFAQDHLEDTSKYNAFTITQPFDGSSGTAPTILADFEENAIEMERTTGYPPNTTIIGIEVLSAMLQDTTLRNEVYGTANPTGTREARIQRLGETLGRRIIPFRSVYTKSDGDVDFISSKVLLDFYVPEEEYIDDAEEGFVSYAVRVPWDPTGWMGPVQGRIEQSGNEFDVVVSNYDKIDERVEKIEIETAFGGAVTAKDLGRGAKTGLVG